MNKQVVLNSAQYVVLTAPQKTVYVEGGRGMGKTTIIGGRCTQLVKQMPKASFAMVGKTYSQILTRFIPAIKEGLELFGLYQDYDYVIGSSQGKKKGFAMPFQSPESWHNIIHFSNGAIFQLVSLDHADSGRGLNAFAIVNDETAICDEEKLAVNVKNTNRAQKDIFKKCSLLHSELYTSSTPITKKGKWFVDKEELAKKKPNKVMFLKATAKVNMQNLRPDYFEYMKEAYTSEVIYNAEMLNIRPKEIKDGFYAQLNPDIHYYTDFDNDGFLTGIPLKDANGQSFDCRQDLDLDPNLPLIMGVDWGANINSMVIAQYKDNTYRVLKSFFVKTPKILDHLWLEKFLPYYKYHKTKTVKFYYDRQGNSRTANSKKTFADQASDIMRNHGWKVEKKTIGKNPDYLDKFRLFNLSFRDEGRTGLPIVRFNEVNCADLIISMEHAEARETSKGFEKDKRSERSKVIPQQHATHLSDAFDYPFYAMFKGGLSGKSVSEEDRPMETIVLK